MVIDLGTPVRMTIRAGDKQFDIDPIEVNNNVLAPAERRFADDSVARLNEVKQWLAGKLGVDAAALALNQVLEFESAIIEQVQAITQKKTKPIAGSPQPTRESRATSETGQTT